MRPEDALGGGVVLAHHGPHPARVRSATTRSKEPVTRPRKTDELSPQSNDCTPIELAEHRRPSPIPTAAGAAAETNSTVQNCGRKKSAEQVIPAPRPLRLWWS